MRYAQILSTGRYAPERVVTNAELGALFPERDIDGWLRANVGIEERRFMADEETTSDLSLYAARQALQRAGVAPEALDLIIVATDTPDYISPATATVLQAKLGAPHAGTFDINTACAGWVTAMDMPARSHSSSKASGLLFTWGNAAARPASRCSKSTYGSASSPSRWYQTRRASLSARAASAVLLP